MFDTGLLATIHTAFAGPVTWSQGAVDIEATAVLFHGDGDDPIGVGNSVRQRGYEIPYSGLPFNPMNGDLITDGGTGWRVIDVTDYEEAEAWRVFVERST